MKASDVKKVTISILFLANISNAKANCEAGGYFIHTKATYHQDANIIFLKGGSTPKKMSATLETMNNPAPSGKYKLSTLLKNCESIYLKVQKSEDEYGAERYTIEGCPEIDSDSKYIYQLDVVKKTITLGKDLVVKSTLDNYTSILEKNIRSVLDKTTLNAQTMDKTSFIENEKKIDKNDILNSPDYRFDHTQIGKKFTMSIALLELKNLPKYFRLYDIPPAEKTRIEAGLSKMTASFPVIYFTRNEKTEFVGDGAWCSDKAVNDLMYSLFMRDKSTQPPSKLGDIYKYNVTDAYDINGDGEPDIITINDAVSYWLKDNNSFVVIGSQFGY